jgi:hypothetical protein
MERFGKRLATWLALAGVVMVFVWVEQSTRFERAFSRTDAAGVCNYCSTHGDKTHAFSLSVETPEYDVERLAGSGASF